MSVLDMFASALGAFLLIAIILFPYYTQSRQISQKKAELAEKMAELSRLSASVDQQRDTVDQQQDALAQSDEIAQSLAECHEAIVSCEAAAAETFLVIAIEWDDPGDVDLYVTDPDGVQYSYAHTTANAVDDAHLSLDMREGPGMEIWQDPSAKFGEYKVTYNLLSAKVPSVPVRGWIIDRSQGQQDLPLIRLTQKTDVAKIVIGEDGSVSIEAVSQ